MKLTVLGNNGPFPAPNGACSGYLLQCGKSTVQLDLGCGVLSALTALTAPEELDALVLSHWHSDHVSDLLPLIYRLESLLPSGVPPLHVYAPLDEASPVRRAAQATPAIVLHDVRGGDSLTVGEAHITFFEARHPVPAVMMRIVHADKTLCYTGDTNLCDALPRFAENADLLLMDGLFPENAWDEKKPHLSAALCARLSVDAHAKRLVITHLHPGVDPETLLRQARAIRPDAELSVRHAAYEL